MTILSVVRRHAQMKGKAELVIQVGRGQRETARREEPLDPREVILGARLGVDRLADLKPEAQPKRVDRDLVCRHALAVHLDSRLVVVPPHHVAKAVEIEVASELAVDAYEGFLLNAAVTPAASS
jgi:hypothetical protein